MRFLGFEDEQTEATSVVEEIAALIEGGVAPGDVAILFRTNEQPRLFEGELRRKRLRDILIGGQSFYDRREIRDLLAYLKVVARPTDESALLRIINTPPRGIGDATIDKLTTRAVKAGKNLWQVVPEAQAAGEIPARALAGLEELQNLLARLRRQFDEGLSPLPELFDHLLESVNYKSEIERLHDEPEQQLARMGALEQLRESIELTRTGPSRRHWPAFSTTRPCSDATKSPMRKKRPQPTRSNS